jgi:hypothetical protein
MSDFEAAGLREEPKRRGTRVRDKDGDTWKRGNTRWTCEAPVDGRRIVAVGRLPWYALVSNYGPLTLVTEEQDDLQYMTDEVVRREAEVTRLEGELRVLKQTAETRRKAYVEERDAHKALRAGIEALASRFEREGITCECGHYVGSDHNSLGCYARLSYKPTLVTCPCTLTDDQDESEIVAKAIRALLEEK